MVRFAFISRHVPTAEQISMAAESGIELVQVGDFDAFMVSPSFLDSRDDGPFEGAVVVHPATAMRLAGTFLIGVFENATRWSGDGKPQFEAKALHVFDMRD